VRAFINIIETSMFRGENRNDIIIIIDRNGHECCRARVENWKGQHIIITIYNVERK